MKSERKGKKLIIIDANSVLHRAFHALPPLTLKSGLLVNAVYGFLLVFLRVIKEFQPDFIAVAFDFPAPTLRHREYKAYKAKRPKAPDEFLRQIPKVKELIFAFNVPIFEKEGYEADDIIAAISKDASKSCVETIIVSGDLDTLQLINEKVRVYVLRKGVKNIILYDEDLVAQKFNNLRPIQLVDFKALRGDPSDNIPGVAGIGEKTALDLVSRFGGLETLYKKAEKNKELSRGVKEKLLFGKKEAFLSKELVRLDRDVPLDFQIEECNWKKYDKKKVAELLKKMEFYSLIDRLPGSPVGENLRLW